MQDDGNPLVFGRLVKVGYSRVAKCSGDLDFFLSLQLFNLASQKFVALSAKSKVGSEFSVARAWYTCMLAVHTSCMCPYAHEHAHAVHNKNC